MKGPVGSRCGAVMFVALACLAVTAAIAAAIVQGVVVGRRHLRSERDLLQAECLLDMAADRALAALAAGGPGDEVVELPAAAITGVGDARIARSVAPGPDGARVVTLVVEYPLGAAVTIRRTRVVPLPTTPSDPQETVP